MKPRPLAGGLLALAFLLGVGAWPAAGARAAEAVAYKLVLDLKRGNAVADGVVPLIGRRFSIGDWVRGQRLDMSGEIEGNRVRVTGDWNGDYMSGEGEIVNGACQLDLRPTGTILSAFISLTIR